eukprot:1319689-Rhodomonas_salina.4
MEFQWDGARLIRWTDTDGFRRDKSEFDEDDGIGIVEMEFTDRRGAKEFWDFVRRCQGEMVGAAQSKLSEQEQAELVRYVSAQSAGEGAASNALAGGASATRTPDSERTP